MNARLIHMKISFHSYFFSLDKRTAYKNLLYWIITTWKIDKNGYFFDNQWMYNKITFHSTQFHMKIYNKIFNLTLSHHILQYIYNDCIIDIIAPHTLRIFRDEKMRSLRGRAWKLQRIKSLCSFTDTPICVKVTWHKSVHKWGEPKPPGEHSSASI